MSLYRLVLFLYSVLAIILTTEQPSLFSQVRHPIKWRYLINIAGQSFPLKTNEEIVNILRIYNGANDIEGIYGRRILKSRFQKEWVEENGKVSHSMATHSVAPNLGSGYSTAGRRTTQPLETICTNIHVPDK